MGKRHATRHNKRDSNEAGILRTLGQLGVRWIEAGPLDGWALVGGEWIPVEIKVPGGRLTAEQAWFIACCCADGAECKVLRSSDDAISWVLKKTSERSMLKHARTIAKGNP